MVRMDKVKWFIHKLWVFSAFIIITIALLLGIARLVTPMISGYEDKIAVWLGDKLNVSVEIGSIEAGWHGFEPGFRIRHLAVLTDQAKPALTVSQAYVGISILQSLLQRTVILGHLHIDGVNLILQHELESWKIIGLPAEKLSNSHEQIHADKVFDWILKQPYLELKNINIDFVTWKNEVIPFRHFSATIVDAGDKHQIQGVASIAGKRITKFNFALNALGHLSDLGSVKAKFYLEGKHVKLVPWQAYFPQLATPITDGNISFKLQGLYESGVISDLRSDYTLQNITFSDKDALPMINMANGHLTWDWAQHGGWEVATLIKRLEINGKAWPKNWLCVRKNVIEADGPGEITVALKYAKISVLQKLLTKLPENFLPESPLDGLQLSGDIEEFNMMMPIAKQVPWQFSVKTKFKNVGFNQWKNLPTVRGVNGELSVDSEGGQLIAYSSDAYINFPNVFDKLFHLQALKLKADWKKETNVWQLKVPSFYVSDGFAKSTGSFSLQLPENNKPSIAMLAGVKIPQFEQGELNDYFPTKVIPESLDTWLKQAIKKGKDLQVAMVLHGDLNKFPFIEQQGTFKAEGYFSQLDLAYHPKWPLLENLSGKIRFDGVHMNIDINQGQSLNNKIMQAVVNIASVIKKPLVLTATTKVQGALQNGLQFITESPLNDTVGQGISGITANGQMMLDLDLSLPLESKETDEPTKVTGDLLLYNNTIHVPRLPFAIDVQHGGIHFTEKAIASNIIKANVLNEPISITLTTGGDATQKTLISAQGVLTIAALEQKYGITLAHLLKGETPYQADIELQKDEPNKITVTTDWKGVDSTLPPPFAKSTQQEMPTTVAVFLDKNGDIRTKSVVADILTGQLNWIKQKDSDVYQQNGVFQVNQNKTIGLPKTGILLTGHLQQWLWKDWQPVLALFDNEQFSEKEHSRIFVEKLQVDKAHIAGLQLPSSEVSLEKKKNNWALDFSGSDIMGKAIVSVDNKSADILVDLNKLVIIPVESSDEQAIITKPTDIPNIKASCESCFFKDSLLGKVQLRLKHANDGLRMELLEVDNDMFQLTAYGLWQKNNNSESTEVTGQLTTSQLSDTLQSWQLPGNVHSRKAHFDFDVEWLGNPKQFSLHTLSGNVNADIKAGWIAGLSKKTGAKLGFGKLLNLLSLQSLPKRLSLDFQDITHSGYYFDLLDGHFNFKHGNVSTENLKISGNVANILIQGRAGLVKEDYGLKLTVMPHVTSSLPLIATIAGGPVAGAVTWALDKAMSSGVDKMTRYEYLVTGPWQNPVIYPLKKSMHRIPGKPAQQQQYHSSIETET